jgi:hypothetical protein
MKIQELESFYDFVEMVEEMQESTKTLFAFFKGAMVTSPSHIKKKASAYATEKGIIIGFPLFSKIDPYGETHSISLEWLLKENLIAAEGCEETKEKTALALEELAKKIRKFKFKKPRI